MLQGRGLPKETEGGAELGIFEWGDTQACAEGSRWGVGVGWQRRDVQTRERNGGPLLSRLLFLLLLLLFLLLLLLLPPFLSNSPTSCCGQTPRLDSRVVLPVLEDRLFFQSTSAEPRQRRGIYYFSVDEDITYQVPFQLALRCPVLRWRFLRYADAFATRSPVLSQCMQTRYPVLS